MSVCAMVRDLGDLTSAVEALIDEAKEEAIADAISDMELKVEELENTIYELRETIAELHSDLDDRNEEIANLHKELMAND